MKNFGTISKSFHRPYNGLYGISGTFPLAGINDLSATESGGTVSLTWTDPDDVVKGGKTVASWTSTKLVRKEGSAPTDSTDGDLILTETTKNQYSSSGYVDSTIPASGTYYYVAFAVADNGLETISNVEEVAVVQQYKTFTITREEKSDMSSGRVYSDDATGMTAGSTDFDEFFGYSAVLLAPDGSEVEEVVQSSPGTLDMNSFQGALTGTANNVMIKFPRRGIKMTKDGNFVSLSITDDPDKAGFQYYAFTKGTTAKNNLYLGAYNSTYSDDNVNIASAYSSSTYLKSRATGTRVENFSPETNQSIIDKRVSMAKYGNGYSLFTFYPRQYIACLYMMKYGNPNSQNVVGRGASMSDTNAVPGATNTITSATGMIQSTYQIKMFGLENIRGGKRTMLDGAWRDGSKNLTVDKTNSVFQSSPYNTSIGTQQNCVVCHVYGNDGMFIPSTGQEADAGYQRYYGDQFNVGGNSILLNGGGINTSMYQIQEGGLFYMNYSGSGTGKGYNVSSRLQYL